MREDYADLTEHERWLKSKGIGMTNYELFEYLMSNDLNGPLSDYMLGQFLRTGEPNMPSHWFHIPSITSDPSQA
jgi:hypothetical protein